MLFRATVVWLLMILIETAHGVLRTSFLAPVIGDFHARQVGVFLGALLILMVAYLFDGWLRAKTTAELLTVGVLWLMLTLIFEVGVGRLVLGLSWERIGSDHDIRRGGLLVFGLLFLVLSPLIAARLRVLAAGRHRRAV